MPSKANPELAGLQVKAREVQRAIRNLKEAQRLIGVCREVMVKEGLTNYFENEWFEASEKIDGALDWLGGLWEDATAEATADEKKLARWLGNS